jgi:hypothetical protein
MVILGLKHVINHQADMNVSENGGFLPAKIDGESPSIGTYGMMRI